jgi:hypothetical protein
VNSAPRNKKAGVSAGLSWYSNPNSNQFDAPVTMTPETMRSSLLGSPNIDPPPNDDVERSEPPDTI